MVCNHAYTCLFCRGYSDKHVDPETDSDGDGGPASKLRGSGHIEFSSKGIPHGILHFPEQLQSAGHIYMHDTCAPEGAHRDYIKKAMDRVRKTTDKETSESMVKWVCQVRVWAKIINQVLHERELHQAKRPRITVPVNKIKVTFTQSRAHNTISPLGKGGFDLMTSDIRLSYNEVGHIIHTIYILSYMIGHACMIICA